MVQIGRSILMLMSNHGDRTGALATASAIGFTSPLIVTALSVPLLHETVGWRRWSTVICGLCRGPPVIRPGARLSDPAVLLLLLPWVRGPWTDALNYRDFSRVTEDGFWTCVYVAAGASTGSETERICFGIDIPIFFRISPRLSTILLR
jgi:hypothetical protein